MLVDNSLAEAGYVRLHILKFKGDSDYETVDACCSECICGFSRGSI